MANLRDMQELNEKFGAVTALYADCLTQIQALQKRVQNLELKNAREAKGKQKED